MKAIAKSKNNLVIIGKITFLAFVIQLIQGEDLFYPAQQALLYSWRFFRTAPTIIGYFKITCHLTTKLFPAKISEWETSMQDLRGQRITVHCYSQKVVEDPPLQRALMNFMLQNFLCETVNQLSNLVCLFILIQRLFTQKLAHV